MDKITIMVVDDSPFASKQIQDVVEENGYEVVAYAANGEDGIKLYDEMHPDIVIMDIIMPGLDGLETAQILMKKHPEEVRGIGLKYLIPKPWEDDVLLATLEMLSR